MAPSAILPLLLLLSIARGSIAADYPNCPLTGKQPVAPVAPHTRCPAAANAACCTDCADLNTALTLAASNLTSVVEQIEPSLASLVPPELRVCDIFVGQQSCAVHMEDILCGATCNPDSGNYATVTKEGPVLSLCEEFANATFEACKGVTVAGFILGEVLPTPYDLIQNVVVNTIRVLGIENFNATVAKPGVTATCFAGSSARPAATACCDPLLVPDTCPADAVDEVLFANLIGKAVNTTECPASAVPPPAMPPSGSPPGSPATSAGTPPAPTTAAPPAPGSGGSMLSAAPTAALMVLAALALFAQGML